MDLKTFSLNYNINLNIRDSSIKEENVIKSLYDHIDIVNEDIQIKYHTKPNDTFNYKERDKLIALMANMDIIIPNDSVNKEYVIKSLFDNLPDLKDDTSYKEYNSISCIENDQDDSIINFRDESVNKDPIILKEPPAVQKMIQINSASEEELNQLPGIRLVQAKKIIQLRQFKAYITSFNDLKEKIGLNDKEINELKRYLIIDKVEDKQEKHGRILDI